MIKTKELLDEIEIPFWLDCGTLLWMYRDGKPDETDTDLSIHEKDLYKLLSNLHKFLEKGYVLHRVWTYKNYINEISFFYEGKKIDIFVTYFKDNWGIHIANWPYEGLITKMPKEMYESHDKLGEWNIPSQVEKYLELYYTKDWKTPNPNWQPTDPPCVDKEFKL